MSPTWQVICFALAAFFFLLAALDVTVSMNYRRRPVATGHFIALGLLAWVAVPLVTAINAL